MKRYKLAVIGDPISHSLSPTMHAAALEAAGIEANYVPTRVPHDRLREYMEAARGGDLLGFNVTIPHKQTVVPHLDALTDTARVLGAVNTVTISNGNLQGENTDAAGFREALLGMTGHVPASALVLGTGGAARAVAWVLQELGTRVAVTGRTSHRLDALKHTVPGARAVPWADRETVAAESEVVVNATSVGLAPGQDLSPVRHWHPVPGAFAMDLIYGRCTPFLRGAADSGRTVSSGDEMLLHQGAAAFYLWFGIWPDLRAMRAAISAHNVETT